MHVKVNTNKSGELVAEVVKENKKTVLIRLPDGHVIKKRRELVTDATEEEVEQFKRKQAELEAEEVRLKAVAAAAAREIAKEETAVAIAAAERAAAGGEAAAAAARRAAAGGRAAAAAVVAAAAAAEELEAEDAAAQSVV